MRSQSPAFSFYPKDWLSDANVKAMTLEAKGAYIELLGIYWLEDGLPAELERLARLVGIPLWRFRRLWTLIEPCFQIVENRLIQKRLEHERAKQQAYTNSQRAKGLKGGRPITIGIKTNIINKNEKPVVSPGKAEGGAEKSLPSPSPSPSPYTERTDGRTDRPAIRANPLLGPGERPKRESELLELVAREGALTNRDPVEVMCEVSGYEGARTSKLNPANMTDDRLLNSLLDARARVARLEKLEVKHGRPTS